MSTEGPKTGYAFVIDTDSYAGNFEREMTAHITGQIGDCEVGEEYIEELPIDFGEIIKQVPDDNGTYRPTTCWREPKSGQYNSVAIFFYKKPTQEQIDFMKERAETFSEVNMSKSEWAKEIKVIGYRLIQFVSEQNEITI